AETNGLDAVPIRAHDGGQVDELAVEQKHVAVFSVAESESAVRNGVEDWLDVGRRSRDHPQDLARCGQVAVASLQFLEEPHILDSDHSLIGKGPQQLNLAIRERAGLCARPLDDADGSTFPQHGDEEAASPADRAAQGLMLVLRVEVDIGYVDNRALEDRSACK